MQRLSQEELFGSQAETFGVKVKPKHRKEDQKHLLSPPLSRKHKAMENFALITSFFSVIFFFFLFHYGTLNDKNVMSQQLHPQSRHLTRINVVPPCLFLFHFAAAEAQKSPEQKNIRCN